MNHNTLQALEDAGRHDPKFRSATPDAATSQAAAEPMPPRHEWPDNTPSHDEDDGLVLHKYPRLLDDPPRQT